MSRVEVDGRRIIEICSKCGEDEAMEQFFGGGLSPVSDWPIEDWMAMTNQLEESVETFRKLREEGLVPQPGE